MSTVERTVRYATTVDELGEAFDFVLEHRPKVGPKPNIHIRAITVTSPTEYDGWLDQFEVSVSGTTTGGE